MKKILFILLFFVNVNLIYSDNIKYSGNFNLGGHIDIGEYRWDEPTPGFQISTEHGIKIPLKYYNKIFTGIGIEYNFSGYKYKENYWYLPIYIKCEYLYNYKKPSMYYGLKIGYSHLFQSDYVKTENTGILGINLGIRIPLNSDICGFKIGCGYNYIFGNKPYNSHRVNRAPENIFYVNIGIDW